jgi:hypothetical protein
MGTRWRVSVPRFLPSFPLPFYDTSPTRLGHTISSAYIVTFQTHVFSVLPASFAAGFKRLLAATLALSTEGVTPDIPASVQDSRLWPSFELLGLADRYESLIASVCYEHIEKHVVETCTGKWDEPMLSQLREWMAEKVVPWMLLPYARGAKTGAWPVPSPPLPVLSLDSRTWSVSRGSQDDVARCRISIRFPCLQDAVRSSVNFLCLIRVALP